MGNTSFIQASITNTVAITFCFSLSLKLSLFQLLKYNFKSFHLNMNEGRNTNYRLLWVSTAQQLSAVLRKRDPWFESQPSSLKSVPEVCVPQTLTREREEKGPECGHAPLPTIAPFVHVPSGN